MKIENTINKFIASIKSKKNKLSSYLSLIQAVNNSNMGVAEPEYWHYEIITSSLKRTIKLIDTDFNNTKELELLAVTRHIFEVVLWMKLLKKDKRYGLVYYLQLIKAKLKYWKSLKHHLDSEIELLEMLALEEKKLFKEEVSTLINQEDVGGLINKASNNSMQMVDNKAALKLLMFGEDAKINGYSFQAHIIKAKSMPEIENNISVLNIEKEDFNNNISENISDLIEETPRRFNFLKWRYMAEKVDMLNDYDFIYSFSSSLLHASPASLTSNNEELELLEILLFLRFIKISISEIDIITKEYLLNMR